MRDWGAQAQRLVARRAQTVVVRKVTRTKGPDPRVNPPVYTGPFVVSGAAAQGASALSLRAAKVTSASYLKAGDSFVITGDPTTYTVTADANGSGNVFPGVPISPPLAVAASDGTEVAVTFAGDASVPAAVVGYPLSLVDGTAIVRGDLRIIIAAPDLPVDLTTLDLVLVNGQPRAIINIDSADATIPSFWDIQAR